MGEHKEEATSEHKSEPKKDFVPAKGFTTAGKCIIQPSAIARGQITLVDPPPAHAISARLMAGLGVICDVEVNIRMLEHAAPPASPTWPGQLRHYYLPIR